VSDAITRAEAALRRAIEEPHGPAGTFDPPAPGLPVGPGPADPAALRDPSDPAAVRDPAEPLFPGGPTGRDLVEVFADQVASRYLDVAARDLKAKGAGYYTISSAGHEHTAIVGALTRPDDPAFLHYRDGAFVMARARRGGAASIERDVLYSLCAAQQDPVAQGRHKVWGSRELWIPPQTSTIASQLPKAMGAAVAIGRARRLGQTLPVSDDAIAVTSFGDASANHASALSAINGARWARRVGNPMPILFVCEDNGIGISVSTPRDWIAETFGNLSGLTYVPASGDIDQVWGAVASAVERCRRGRRPVFLHLRTVRLWGHAGSDVETGYRSREEIAAEEALDPLPLAARRLLALGVVSREQLTAIVADTRQRIGDLAEEVAATATHLADAATVIAPLAPFTPDRVREEGARRAPIDVREAAFPHGVPEQATSAQRRTLAANLNAALRDLLLARDEVVLFGEDVGRKGGVYGVTAGLQAHFGTGRVFDSLLDETSILGLAQGLGLLGQLPIPEIQYLAYLHNAIDQLRGEACSTSFFSNGQFTTPMVVRIAGLAYQKGFGGHFHNDNAVGALRDIPGLALAVPSRPADAVRMLRAAVGMAAADGRVVAFLEPIALYHERDLYEDGDEGWVQTYPDDDEVVVPGEVGVHGGGPADLVMVTYGNGVRMSLRAARRLADGGIRVRVLDLRWLAPLPLDAVREHAADVGAVLVVDEARATGGGIADAVVAALTEVEGGGPSGGVVGRTGRSRRAARGNGPSARVASVRSVDSYVPLGPAADAVLLSEDQVMAAAERLVQPARSRSRGRRWRRRGAAGN
jgi:2-oxoisovalerate dehydrogenase E1 component